MITDTILSAALVTATALQQPSASAVNEAAVEFIIGDVAEAPAGGPVVVSLRLLNGGARPVPLALPDRVQAELQSGQQMRKVWLERSTRHEQDLLVPAGGFAHAEYRLRETDGLSPAGGVLSIPAWSRQRIMIAASVPAPDTAETAQQTTNTTAETILTEKIEVVTALPAGGHARSAFMNNFSAYEPIYMVYGPSSVAEARVQLSFKYRLFGSRREQGLAPSWREGMHLAFTQRMFWDLGAESSPFRNIDYLPELFYLSQSATLTSGISLAGQAGVRHESNGRDGPESRSLNTIYVAPMAAIPMENGYRLIVAPRLSFLIGSKRDNHDILKYRGATSLFVELGKDDGLRMSTSSRFNFSSGHGALSFDISYPLIRLLGGGPDFYLFGQSFIGHGENLLDYNRHTARFRAGLAIIR